MDAPSGPSVLRPAAPGDGGVARGRPMASRDRGRQAKVALSGLYCGFLLFCRELKPSVHGRCLWTVGLSIRMSVHSVCPLRLPPWPRAPFTWSNHSPTARLTAPMPCRLAEGVCCKEFSDAEHLAHMKDRDHQTARAADPSMSGRSPWVYTIVHHPLASASRRRTSEPPSRSAVLARVPSE